MSSSSTSAFSSTRTRGWTSSRRPSRTGRASARTCARLVVGSQARTDVSADRWSDLDASSSSTIQHDSRTRALGRGVRRAGADLPGAHGDRRAARASSPLRDGRGRRLPARRRRQAARPHPDGEDFLARGYRVLHDELGLEERTAELQPPAAPAPPNAAAPQLASDFWYHALWTAKKLRRGEVFTALECLDGYMKARIVTLLEWHARAVDPAVDTWHGGRYLERWADPGALVALEARTRSTACGTSRARSGRQSTSSRASRRRPLRRLGLAVELDHPDLRRRVAGVVPDPRHGATL